MKPILVIASFSFLLLFQGIASAEQRGWIVWMNSHMLIVNPEKGPISMPSDVEWWSIAEAPSLAECNPLKFKVVAMEKERFRKDGWKVFEEAWPHEVSATKSGPSSGFSTTIRKTFYCYPFGFDPRSKK
jgi:hypothetical protein